MNICPHCGAELRDNARFCTVCMTPLNQKRVTLTPKYAHRRWLPMAAAVLVLVLVVGVALWGNRPPKKEETVAGGAPSTTRTHSTDATDSTENNDVAATDSIDKGETTTDTGEISTPSKGESTIDKGETSITTSRGETTTTGKGKTTTTSKGKTSTTSKGETTTTGKGKTTTTNKGETTTTNKGETTTTNKGKTSTTTSKDETTTTSKGETTTTSKGETTTTSKGNADTTDTIYLYRDARAGDDFSVFANLENAVVITGVSNPAPDGVYIIPETLSGKRVIAIMGNAFCADNVKDTVKTVLVPATVRTIWNYAFATCYYLTDIYFFGEAVYTESNAFADPAERTGTLTIHCSSTCTDRALRYYKNAASRYHAQYKELADTEIKALYGGGGQ